MEASTASTVETAAPSASAVAATALSKCCVGQESKSGENSECDQEPEKTESAHNPYPVRSIAPNQRTIDPGIMGKDSALLVNEILPPGAGLRGCDAIQER